MALHATQRHHQRVKATSHAETIMDIPDLPEDRPLTDEEFATLEKQLLETTRALFREVQQLSKSIADEHPEEAELLTRSAAKMLLNVEVGASLDGGPGSMTRVQ
jgi:hypothetical protein